MTTAKELITDSIIDLGKFDPGESPDFQDLNRGLRILNRMISAWSVKNMLISYTTTENFTMVSGMAGYTMGAAGTASSTRARRVVNAFVRDSGSYDYPVEMIDQHKYNLIPNKSLTGIPVSVFYDPVYPVGVLNYYPVPDAAYTAYIESLKNLHDTLTISDTLILDPAYEEAIVANLRLRLAPSYGIAVSQEMEITAREALNAITNLNLANRLQEMEMPAGFGGRRTGYNINQG